MASSLLPRAWVCVCLCVRVCVCVCDCECESRRAGWNVCWRGRNRLHVCMCVSIRAHRIYVLHTHTHRHTHRHTHKRAPDMRPLSCSGTALYLAAVQGLVYVRVCLLGSGRALGGPCRGLTRRRRVCVCVCVCVCVYVCV